MVVNNVRPRDGIDVSFAVRHSKQSNVIAVERHRARAGFSSGSGEARTRGPFAYRAGHAIRSNAQVNLAPRVGLLAAIQEILPNRCARKSL